MMIKHTDSDRFTLSYMQFNESLYEQFLQNKVKTYLSSLLQHSMQNPDIISLKDRVELQDLVLQSEVITTSEGLLIDKLGICTLLRSPTRYCRQRVRFALLPQLHYTKIDEDSEEIVPLEYVLWDGGGPTVSVNDFPIASKVIYELMPLVLHELNQDHIYHEYHGVLAGQIQSIHFLSSTLNEVVITLIYHGRDLAKEEETWRLCIENIREKLLSHPHWKSVEEGNLASLSIIGRSKGVKLIVGTNYVMEHLSLTQYDGRTLRYKQVDDGFSNPNGFVNMKALDWLCKSVKHTIQPCIVKYANSSNPIGTDLLEMYCGNGNHTVALSGKKHYSKTKL